MKWIKFEDGYRFPVKSWCEDVEPGALVQAANLAKHPAVVHHVALMPDCHQGYGMPIGGVIATEDAVIPSAVGVDIGCGMVAVETDIPAERLEDLSFRRSIHTKLKERIPVGDGVSHAQVQQWDGFEEYLDNNGNVADFPNTLDRKNLGTLGGGNHFLEIQRSDDGFVWLMIHSGSRNLGKRIEEFYHKKAMKLNRLYHVSLPDPDLAFLPMEEQEGHDYFRDMLFALRYAAENRRRMMKVFKETFSEFLPETAFLREVNIHHNYAAFEEHFGKKLCIHRKGATSAKADELGIIPGSMGTASYIVRGLGNPESFMSCSHGAGRCMSRTAACTRLTVEECDAAMSGIVCDRWQSYRKYGKGKGLPDLSEAPQAYKAIDDVIAAELDLIQPLVRLTPLAVLKG
ncbi:MAG: RtcB family protein [Lentisphaeria bacterium]|nr:RtcB family protein [Lentisphaeria bacterium]